VARAGALRSCLSLLQPALSRTSIPPRPSRVPPTSVPPARCSRPCARRLHVPHNEPKPRGENAEEGVAAGLCAATQAGMAAVLPSLSLCWPAPAPRSSSHAGAAAGLHAARRRRPQRSCPACRGVRCWASATCCSAACCCCCCCWQPPQGRGGLRGGARRAAACSAPAAPSPRPRPSHAAAATGGAWVTRAGSVGAHTPLACRCCRWWRRRPESPLRRLRPGLRRQACRGRHRPKAPPRAPAPSWRRRLDICRRCWRWPLRGAVGRGAGLRARLRAAGGARRPTVPRAAPPAVALPGGPPSVVLRSLSRPFAEACMDLVAASQPSAAASATAAAAAVGLEAVGVNVATDGRGQALLQRAAAGQWPPALPLEDVTRALAGASSSNHAATSAGGCGGRLHFQPLQPRRQLRARAGAGGGAALGGANSRGAPAGIPAAGGLVLQAAPLCGRGPDCSRQAGASTSRPAAAPAAGPRRILLVLLAAWGHWLSPARAPAAVGAAADSGRAGCCLLHCQGPRWGGL
jgi:hypothetical protein